MKLGLQDAFYKLTLPNGVVLPCKDGFDLDLTLAHHPSVRLFQPQQLKVEVVRHATA